MLLRQRCPILPQHYASLLKSCIARKAIEPGKQLHAQLWVNGLVLNNVNLATKLVNLYSVCSCLTYAHYLFDRIPKTNIFLWNILIRGYAWNGPYEAAISLYHRLLGHGLVPDSFTFPFVLKACSGLSAINVGREIHDEVRKTGATVMLVAGSNWKAAGNSACLELTVKLKPWNLISGLNTDSAAPPCLPGKAKKYSSCIMTKLKSDAKGQEFAGGYGRIDFC
ncbi:Pentatricopeptide repeat-containing protein [Sesamum alatum]|uniref:Pentatricopeptide repeat-containing protein n=1 Tax=Sesamum alatum TaxID=300844 RepID=A0AAE1YJW2_9LAMI|nr:Pentatricopeptide repeat-containing protein [Sesamum alatum]